MGGGVITHSDLNHAMMAAKEKEVRHVCLCEETAFFFLMTTRRLKPQDREVQEKERKRKKKKETHSSDCCLLRQQTDTSLTLRLMTTLSLTDSHSHQVCSPDSGFMITHKDRGEEVAFFMGPEEWRTTG